MVIKLAVVSVFKKKIYIALFFVFAVSFFFLSVFLPVVLTKQDFLLQFKILSINDYVLFGFFSALSSLSFLLFIYSLINTSSISKKAVSGAGIGIFSGLFSAILAGTTCSYCLLAIFGLVGSGFSFFLLDHRIEILLFALILLLLSIFFISKKIIDGCVDCKLH